MLPKDAWVKLDEITEFDSTYDPAKPRRGLYVVPDEVDQDIRAQFQNDEANRLKKIVSSLSSCQLCHANNHIVDLYTNVSQVRVAERRVDEEMFYTNGVYRNSSGSVQQRNTQYTPYEGYDGG